MYRIIHSGWSLAWIFMKERVKDGWQSDILFREEEPLVNMFTFELLVHFVESLSIAHGDEKSLGKIFFAYLFVNSIPCAIFLTFCRLLFFFKLNLFEKFFQESDKSGETVWTQIRPYILSFVYHAGPTFTLNPFSSMASFHVKTPLRQDHWLKEYTVSVWVG